VIDPNFIGKALPTVVTDVERGQLRAFAKAIGETNPIFLDEDAARRAGYRGIPAPPSFAFCLEMLGNDRPFILLDMLGLPLAKALHGEQAFTYHVPICAGDRLTFTATIVDIYAKKNGALEFVVQDSHATNQFGELAVDLRRVVIIRH